MTTPSLAAWVIEHLGPLAQRTRKLLLRSALLRVVREVGATKPGTTN